MTKKFIYTTELETHAKTEIQKRVFALYKREAGKQLERRSQYALKLMTRGKKWERALADALFVSVEGE